jgi:hypothetical protein
MKNMKRYLSFIIAVSLMLMLGSCTKKLEELNVNPNSPTSISPGPLMSYIQLETAKQVDRRSSVGFCMMMMQQTATIKTDDLEGDKYLNSINEGGLFDYTYSTLTPNISALLALTKDNPAQSNTFLMGLIWKVLVYSRVTDIYGDIPYSEAGDGYTRQIYKPKYDQQQDIYSAMLHQLDSAAQHLNASGATVGDADIIYKGNVSQWKKLAYSLMLRLGMHLSKVAPDQAKQWVQKAAAGGVILDNADNCYIQHIDKYDIDQANPISYFFQKFNLLSLGDIKISKTFLDYLMQTKDPRLAIYCSLPNGDADPSHQKGLPNGYDVKTIAGYSGGSDLNTYSTFNTKYILSLGAPTFLVTAAETQLLLSEAAARGWINGNAESYYNNAVKASMEQMSLYGASVSTVQANAYLVLNPYPAAGSPDQQIKAIAYQYWVSTFLDGYASYDNWRRTGYPTLTPVNYPGNASSGTIPRRLSYPQGEYSANPQSIEAAVQEQGPDNYTTRVWWDKQ